MNVSGRLDVVVVVMFVYRQTSLCQVPTLLSCGRMSSRLTSGRQSQLPQETQDPPVQSPPA